jgi:cytochrome c biogenesis protein CcdA/glutaredoxin
MRISSVLRLSLLALLLAACGTSGQLAGPVAHFTLFYSTTCPHCHEVMDNYLPTVYDKYGDQVEHRYIEINKGSNYETMLALEKKLGVSAENQGYVPALVIGDQVLVGGDEIPAKLEGLIDRYLAQGGVDYTTLEAQPPTPGPTVQSGQPIYLAYFEKAGCQECARTTYDLKLVQREYPALVVETFPIESNQPLNEWLSQKYDVPVEKRLSTPMIFVGDDVLIGTEANADTLLAAVGNYAATGAPRTWEGYDPAQGQTGLVERFRSFGALAVLGAGLIDGLNPCAFATLVFFISYMAFTGRRGRDILLVGAAFALGVFLTYLLVGFGLLKVVQALPFFSSLGRWVYLLTAVLCMVLAILTFRDYLQARKGQAGEMTLKLPLSLRRQINRVIREGAQTRAFVLVAFVTGFVVSLIELACTGQVYLPTIVFVLSVPELASKASLYLLLYCLMFIVPLVVVFVIVYFGTTSEQLGSLVSRHTATVKLLTGLLFVGLALWMTWAVVPLFGVSAPWTWISLLIVAAVIAVGIVVAVRLAKRKPAPKKRAASRRRRSRA